MIDNILNGTQLAEKLNQELTKTVQQLSQHRKQPPTLAVILVGNHPASLAYISAKQKACQKVGIAFQLTHLDQDISEETLLKTLHNLNRDSNVHGILVQLPLPDHINKQNIIESITIHKDVDGFHPYNLGLLAQKHPIFRPCTPYGIIQLLQAYDIPLTGQHIVIVGASLIVGLPLTLECLIENMTVTVCHEWTKNLEEHTKQADILVTAVGQQHFIQAHHIKDQAIVIDVGIHKLPNGQLTGDVDFQSVQPKASWITPVPGGVGPMTVAVLLANTVQAYQLHFFK